MVLLAILLVDKYVINLPDRFIRPVNGTTAWYQIPGLGYFPAQRVHEGRADHHGRQHYPRA